MEHAACPKCRISMLRCPDLHTELNGCPSCGGVWLDNDTATALVAGDQAAVMDFVTSIETYAAEAEAAGTYRERAAASQPQCPTCDEPLAEVVVAGDVVVDLCQSHGTFFDRSEVRAMRFAQAVASGPKQTPILLAEASKRGDEAFHQIVAEREARKRGNHIASDALVDGISKLARWLMR